MENFYCRKFRFTSVLITIFFSVLFSIGLTAQSFNSSGLIGETVTTPTSLEFGPDGKLYVAQQDGIIWQLTVSRDGAPAGSGTYSVTNAVSINDITTGVPNHDDDGTPNNAVNERLITGIATAGTSSNPILYVSSSDPRIGAGLSQGDINLDTNSGVLSRLTWNGGSWDRVDLIRGLPRCEENHATNGMDFFQLGGNTYLLLQQGGNTNKGAPSNNFAGTQETFLSSALLIINLTQLESMTVYTDPRNGSQYIYDLPTLNDPERADIDNTSPSFPYPVGHPMRNATIDIGDPFGGNDGLNQAFPETGAPVQIFSPGYRNAYDVLVTADGRIFTGDNGGNQNWGGTPLIFTSADILKGDEGSTTYDPGAGDYITNGFNEGNSVTVQDGLHYVGTINDPNGTYYGGHPVPIRAFPSRAGVIKHEFNGSSWVVDSNHDFGTLLSGTSGYFNTSFTIGDFPDDSDQGFFLADKPNDPSMNILDFVSSSTNGLCEYTASNFGGAMQGDLLTASFGGQINRYELDGSGTGLLAKDNTFLTGFGSIPLDVIAQGDSDPFAGTIWVVTYGNFAGTSGGVTVFEPADFGTCLQPDDNGYIGTEDYDNDGYTNDDEVAAGTDHCNGGSQPSDNDGDFVSDFTDTDDDNDGILDPNDSFAHDADNGTTTNLPINYPFWNNDPGTGFFGLGFTGWMNNGTTDYLDQYDPDNLSFGGAGGKATIDAVTEGDAFQNLNNQDNAFQFGINVDSNTDPFTVHSRIDTPFAGIIPEDFQSYGIYIGTGDQDNYLKVVIMDGVTNGDGINGFEVLLEENGVATNSIFDVPNLLAATVIDIYISIDPAANTAQPLYSLDGGANITVLGSPLTLPTSFLDATDNQGMAVGLISTSVGPGSSFTATWDFMNITFDGSADLSINPDPVDFGTLAVDSGIAQLNVSAQNNGGPTAGSIDITDITFSGTDASLFSNNTGLPVQIGPSNSQNIELQVAPDGSAGTRTANMVITHTGDNSPLIVPVVVELTDFAVRINAGGTQTTYQGNTYSADQFSVGGSTFHNTAATQLPLIYQTERNSQPKTFSYDIPVADGDYTVILHFAEIYWGAPGGGSGGTGQRIFDVNIEGTLVLDNYDINADVGPATPVTKSFDVTVSDQLLEIDFSALSNIGGVDQPKVAAIEVLGGSSQFPPITLSPIADQNNQEGDSVNGLAAGASGGDPNANFTYSISGQPVGVNIEPTNGQIFGTIAAGASTGGINNDGIHNVTVTASKPGSVAASENFVWTVQASSLSWVNKSTPTNYTARHENSFVQAGDKFYLMGGRENSQTIDVYDYTTNTWSSLTNSAPFAFNHFQATEYQGLIWVIGAFKDNGFPTETSAEFVWAFDPANEEWIQGPQIPANRRRGSAGLAVYNDKFYIVGGNNNGHDAGFVAQFDEYDPATGTWTPLADAPRARDHFATAVIDGKLYAAGGRLTSTANGYLEPTIPEVDVYDFATSTWSTLPAGQNIPTERGGASTINFNGNLVVIGGEIAGQTPALAVTEQYNPNTGNWSQLADLNSPRHGTQAIVSGNGIFIVAGSPTAGGGNQQNMEYLGVDAPVGSPSVASTLSVPSSLVIDDTTNSSFSMDVANGNTGIIVTSMQLSGPNASSFSVASGQLANGLIKPNTSHSVTIDFNGTTDGETATLTINYGVNDQVTVALEGNLAGNQNGVVSLVLVNADTDNDILILADGQQIDPTAVQGINLNIRANTNPTTVGSVSLSISGTLTNTRTENVAPYALYGDAFGDYVGVPFPEGSYTVSATAFSGPNQGGTVLGTLTRQFSIMDQGGGNQAPTAITSALPLTGDAPLQVAFTGSNSTDDVGITGYLWNFDDNTTSTQADPSHTFNDPGTYNVTLMVTDGGGLSDTDTIVITVDDPVVNAAPTAVATGIPLSGDAPLQVSFTGSNSTDDVGITSYLWDFDDTTTSTQADPVHVFSNPGTYNVTLTVTDGEDLSDSDTLTITVDDPTSNDVVTFTLVNADTDSDIFNLTDGQQIDPSVVQGINLNIRANTIPATVGSVSLSISGTLTNTRTENVAPYALYGDAFGDYVGVTFPEGSYTMSATAFSGPNQSGTVLGTNTLQFSITDQGGSNNPPVVTNPGTQNNNEGDTVSLQIQATDASTNLAYAATGLPPNLSINPNTGLISGTVSSGGSGSGFQESNGLVVIEAESGNLVPDWSQTTTGGATGIMAGSNHFNDFNGGTIPYQINIATPGVYRFNWRSFYSGSDPTEENDNWLRFPNNDDVWFFGFQGTPVSEGSMISNLQGAQNNIVFPKGSSRITAGTTPFGSGGNGYFKVVRSGGAPETYSWQALTSDGDGHDIYVWFVNPGTYTMEISERSAGHAIDKMALYKVDGQNYTNAQLTAAPESQTGGPGAADNSPYTVQVTVTDDGVPPLATPIQFTWIIGEGSTNNPPTAIATGTPLSGDAPLQVSFTGSNSTDDNGITGYLWDFDDNTTSTLANPVHTFSNPGTYDVTLTVTDGGGLSDSETITITANNPSQNGIVSFTLVNADTDTDLFDLSDGQQIGLSTTGLSIRANTNPVTVGSVSISLNGPVNATRVENVAPYALFGDFAGDYNGVQFPLGNYTISATAFSGSNQSGTVLGTQTLQFSVQNTAKGLNTDDTVVSVDGKKLDTQKTTITFYPNPASSETQIHVSNPSTIISKIYIYDISGRLVRKMDADQLKMAEDDYHLNVLGLEDGIYSVNLFTVGFDKVFNYKLVVKK